MTEVFKLNRQIAVVVVAIKYRSLYYIFGLANFVTISFLT